MRVISALAVVVLLGACSLGQPASPGTPSQRPETRDFAGGARLRARAWNVAGARVLRDLFDTERGEACAFVEDGVWRLGPGPSYYCLPLGMAVHDDGFGPYADSHCTVAVGRVSSAESASYVLTRPVDACASAPSVHRAAPPSTYAPWFSDGASCVRSPAKMTVQTLGEPVPLASFVRAEERVEARGGRVGSLVAVAEDGARQTLGGVDGELGPVRVDALAQGSLRWVPSRVAFQGAGEILFGDANCNGTVPTKLARDAVCPLTAMLAFTDACGGAAFYRLGKEIAASELFEKTDAGACARVKATLARAYEQGAPIATLPEAFAVEVIGDLVRRRGFAGPGGGVVAWGEIIDATTNEPCDPALASDGVQRCLPTASADVTLFADDACTIPAFAQPITGCERGVPPRFVRTTSSEGAHVYEVTGDAPVLYQAKGDRCVAFTPLAPSQGFAVQEVAVDRFVKAEEEEL